MRFPHVQFGFGSRRAIVAGYEWDHGDWTERWEGPVSCSSTSEPDPREILLGTDWFCDGQTFGGWCGSECGFSPATREPANIVIGTGEFSSVRDEGGILTHYAVGADAKPVFCNGRIVGQRFRTVEADYLFVTGMTPTATGATPFEQTVEVFQLADRLLRDCGYLFRDVIRTWYYLDDILSWYDDFNLARTSFFRERGIFGGIMPASTGVGAANPRGAAVSLNFVAFRPRLRRVAVRRVDSPLQCSAYDYGSAFSRAIAIDSISARRLHISGTASIEPGGKTAHVGDLMAQIELSVKVVEAMLEAEGMAWRDVTRAIGYFRNADEIPQWDHFADQYGLPDFPILLTQADICRDDLLFEMELEAITEPFR